MTAGKNDKDTDQELEARRAAADRVLEDLEKRAFANIADIVRVDAGDYYIDFEKAREVDAVASRSIRRVGRGENAKESNELRVKLPNKFRALILLGRHLGLFK